MAVRSVVDRECGGDGSTPEHLQGLREGQPPALARENISVTFIENVEALNADSLKHFQLLIILRDGMNWPNGYDKEPVKWMTDAQQQATR